MTAYLTVPLYQRGSFLEIGSLYYGIFAEFFLQAENLAAEAFVFCRFCHFFVKKARLADPFVLQDLIA